MQSIKTEHLLHIGIFHLLYVKNSHPIPEIRNIIKDYMLKVNQVKKPNRRPLRWYSKCSEIMGDVEFDSFIKWYKKNKRRYNRFYSYDDWYNSASSDGSLAYNGVADDF